MTVSSRPLHRCGRSVPALKLLIVGEGEEENNLKNLARSLDLTEQVIFAGLRLDSDTLYPFAELFILPSRWEGMPNAVLEAMAAGKPVVATEVGGVPELVLHGETGILVPPGDTDALAQAILDLLHGSGKSTHDGSGCPGKGTGALSYCCND